MNWLGTREEKLPAALSSTLTNRNSGSFVRQPLEIPADELTGGKQVITVRVEDMLNGQQATSIGTFSISAGD